MIEDFSHGCLDLFAAQAILGPLKAVANDLGGSFCNFRELFGQKRIQQFDSVIGESEFRIDLMNDIQHLDA